MHQRPWSKKSSSFPSDRIRSSSPSNVNNKGKGKARDSIKSKEVRKLEALADGVRASGGKEKDPKGGCFCQARHHTLSPYSPICRDCGLILCELNLPYYACPHCSYQILIPPLRTSLLARLETELSERLAKEERDREQAIEDARKAAGAFPTLTAGNILSSEGGGGVGGILVAPRPINDAAQNQTHKVLSLNSKTKKATLSSYTKSPAHSQPPSRPISRAEDLEPEYVRVPKPPAEVPYVKKLDHTRPWADLKGEGVKYIPSPALEQGEDLRVEEGSEEPKQRTRRNRRGKQREVKDDKLVELNTA